VVRWERMGNRVLLRSKRYGIVADSSTRVSRAVRLSTVQPVLMSFEVAAFSPRDSNLVIEVTKLFTTDVPELNARRVYRLRRLDSSRSLIASARSFPTNIEVRALQTFENDSVPGGDRGLGTASFEMHYSMVLLPQRPMARRLCDNRVGFFAIRQVDYGLDLHRVPRRCYITRWRLEAKDQMDRLINTPLVTPPSPSFTSFPGFEPPPRRTADARSLARMTLREVQAALAAATRAGRITDRTTRAHVADLQARIERILNPR